VKEDSTFNAALAAIKAMKARQNGQTIGEKVVFAGKSYNIDREKNARDEVK